MIMFLLPFIKIRHSPTCILTCAQPVHALFLFLFINMHKEFQHQISVVRKLALKPADTFDPFLIVLAFQLLIQNLLRSLLHPACIQKSKFAMFRDLAHIAVQKWSA